MKTQPNPSDSPSSASLRPDPAKLFARATMATAAVVNALMMSGTAQAQSATPTPKPADDAAADTSGEVTTLSEVVITARHDSYKPEVLQSPSYTAPLLDVPQTVAVVPEALIREQGATSMREVLRNVPGISMQAGEGGFPTGDALTIRGFSARTDFYVDGIRDIGPYQRDPFNLEQVEVSKGASAIMGGRGTTGGAINLVTKTPKLDRFYSGEIGFGTDQYKRFTLDLNQPLNTLGLEGAAFRVNALWTDYTTPNRDWVDNNRWAIAPSLAFGLGTDTRFIFTYLHQQEDNVPDYGLPWVPAGTETAPLVDELKGYDNKVPPVSYSNWYGYKKRDYQKTTTDIGTFEFEHDVSDTFTIRNITRFGRSTYDAYVSAPRFVDPTTTTDVQRSLKTRDQVDWIIADKLDLIFEFNTFGLEHKANLGMEYSHEVSENHVTTALPSANADPTDLFNPNSEDSPTNSTTPNGLNRSVSNSLGLYFAETIKIHEKFEINGAVRWDHFDTDYESLRPTAANTYLDRADEMVSWRVAPVFKPFPNGSVYFAYSTSFNPSAEGLTLSDSTALLDPEETNTMELGTKWEFFDRALAVNAAVFRIEKRNARTPGVLPDDPPTVLEGKQRVTGFELGVAGSITRNWKVYGGYAYMDSEIVDSNTEAEVGKRMPNTPQQTFSLWTTYELPWNVTIGGGANYVGSRFNNTTNERKAPDYWRFDGMVSYKITENMTARLNVYNIADEKYIDRIGGGHAVPGPGRSGTLSLAFSF